MNERVEEIRRQHAEHVFEYPRPHFCEDYGCQTVGVLLTALAQAEAENERLREDMAIERRQHAHEQSRLAVENERLRADKDVWGEAHEVACRRAEQAEARVAALEEALRMCRRLIDIAETTGNGKYLQQAEAFIDAALTEPTPAQGCTCPGSDHYGHGYEGMGRCSPTPPAGGQG